MARARAACQRWALTRAARSCILGLVGSLGHAAVTLLIAAAIVLACSGVAAAVIVLRAIAIAQGTIDDAKSILRRAEHARDRSFAREQLALDVLRALVPVRPEVRAEPDERRRDEHG